MCLLRVTDSMKYFVCMGSDKEVLRQTRSPGCENQTYFLVGVMCEMPFKS